MLRRPRLVRAGDETGYLLRALRNTHVSRLRAASRRPDPVPLPDDPGLVPDRSARPPPEVIEAREVYAAIAALPGDFREAIVAVDVAGLSYGEAGRALGVKEATITTRVHRARLRVARALGGEAPG